jgi:general secretion pathway protein E
MGGGSGSLRGVTRAILNGQGPHSAAQAESVPASDAIPRTPFTALAAGRPLVDRFSPRNLREIGMYVYEGSSGEVRAAISDEQQLRLIDTVAWTLQRQVTPEFATAEDIAAALGRAQVRSNGSVAAVARPDAEEDAVETLRDLASGAPVARAVNEIIELALEHAGASSY